MTSQTFELVDNYAIDLAGFDDRGCELHYNHAFGY